MCADLDGRVRPLSYGLSPPAQVLLTITVFCVRWIETGQEDQLPPPSLHIRPREDQTIFEWWNI